MKKFKRFVMCLMAGVMALSMGSGVLAANDGLPNDGDDLENVFLNKAEMEAFENEEVPEAVRLAMERQEFALEAYQNLWDNFPKDDIGLPIYPDEYAGEYIEDDKLVIMLVNPTEALQEEYTDLCEDDVHVIFEEAEYSLNYLNTMENYVYDLRDMDVQVNSFGIDRRNNEFFISVDKDTDISMVDTYSLETALPIQIRYEDQGNACTSLYGGDKITNEDTSGSMSVGIGGTYNGKNAILTCGHGNERLSIIAGHRYPYIKYGSSRTGQVSYQRANMNSGDNTVNSLGDFSIVTLTGSDTATNKVRYSSGLASITGVYSSLPVGTTVYKYGMKTGYSWGEVQEVSMTLYYSNRYETRGLYSCYMQNSAGTNAIDGGDSGGPVYVKVGSSYKLHGVVTAEVSTSGTVKRRMFSSPIYYAQDAGFNVKTS